MTLDLSLDMPVRASLARGVPWGTIASFAFHGTLAAALVVLSPLGGIALPPERVVTVDVITSSEFEALQQPPPPAPALATPTQGSMAAPSEARLAPTEPLAPDVPEPTTYTATEFYSAGVLRDPENAGVVRTLRTFTEQEQIIQVCNVEAIEQIARAAPEYVPDTVVGYAMSDFVLQGLTVIAAGGAFRSRRRWYEISYTCTAAPGYEAVTAFEFQLGAEIPETLWEAHNLNAEDEEDDDD